MFLSKRDGVFYLWYKTDDGRRGKVSTRAANKSEALKFVQNFRQVTKDRRNGNIPISQFGMEYINYLKFTYSLGTAKLYRHALKEFKRTCGDGRLTLITPRHFDLYKTKRIQEVSPVSVNIELRVLRTALNVAVLFR